MYARHWRRATEEPAGLSMRRGSVSVHHFRAVGEIQEAGDLPVANGENVDESAVEPLSRRRDQSGITAHRHDIVAARNIFADRQQLILLSCSNASKNLTTSPGPIIFPEYGITSGASNVHSTSGVK